MKKITYINTLIFIFALLFTGCYDVYDQNPNVANPEVSEVSDISIGTINSNIYNLLDLSNAEISLDLEAIGDNVSEVIVYQSFNDGEFIELKRINSFPATFTASLTEALALIPETANDLTPGDYFAYSFSVVQTGGSEVISAASFVGTVTCPSALAGTYTAELVSTNTPPGTFRASQTVEITGSAGVYTISDGTMDVFGPDFPIGMNFTEVCGVISIDPPSVEFPTLVIYDQGAGTSLDQDTGIITIDITFNAASCCGVAGLQCTYTLTPN